MPEITIPGLPAATPPLAGTELVPLAAGGVTKRATTAEIAALAVAKFGDGDSGAVGVVGGAPAFLYPSAADPQRTIVIPRRLPTVFGSTLSGEFTNAPLWSGAAPSIYDANLIRDSRQIVIKAHGHYLLPTASSPALNLYLSMNGVSVLAVGFGGFDNLISSNRPWSWEIRCLLTEGTVGYFAVDAMSLWSMQGASPMSWTHHPPVGTINFSAGPVSLDMRASTAGTDLTLTTLTIDVEI